MTDIQEEIKEVMESVPEISWGSDHKIIRKANNRLLYEIFPHASRGYVRSVKSRILKNWMILDAESS